MTGLAQHLPVLPVLLPAFTAVLLLLVGDHGGDQHAGPGQRRMAVARGIALVSSVLGLLLAWAAVLVARRTPNERFTYGLRSSSILAALANAMLLLVACGAATPVVRALQSIAMTIDNPPGQRHLAITLDPGVFAAMAAGAALIAFGYVLREAIRLSDENQSFV